MEQLSLFDDQYNTTTPEDELIENALLRGSGTENGKKRIFEFASTNPTTDKLAKFLRDEYGVGGFGSPKKAPNYIYSESHDAKGTRFEGIDRDGKVIKIELKWIEVAGLIIKMVEKGIYP